MGTAAIGAQARLAVDDALPFDSSSKTWEFVSENIQKRATIIDDAGIRGTRSHVKERTRAGTYTIGGTLVFNPSHLFMDWWLPKILGANESTNTFALAETLPSFYLWIDRVTKGFVYEGCVVSRATLRGSEGQLLELALDIEASREGSDNAGSFVADTLEAAGAFAAASIPAIGITDDDAPFAFTDGVYTLSGTARGIKSFELVIDNVLDTGRFLNNVYRSQIPATDRIVTLRAQTTYTSDEVDLYGQALSGAAATLAFTNTVGAAALTATLAALQVPAVTPVVNGKGEIMLEIEGVARMSSTTRELVFQNVP